MATKNETLRILDRQFDRAARRGTRSHASGRHAVHARYDVRNERVVIELNSGIAIAIPARLIQGLGDATPAARRDLHIAGGGVGLHWPRLDLDISVPNLLEGIFGDREWMSELARHAGSRTSLAKAQAARENGKKGGRPRKTKVEDARRRAG